MKNLNVKKMLKKFIKSSKYEDFEGIYRKFNKKALKVSRSDARKWYDEIGNFVSSKGQHKYAKLVWKKDFLNVWELIPYYKDWWKNKSGNSDLAEEKKYNFLMKIVDVLIECQRERKEDGEKKYRILSIFVDVFFAYGDIECGIFLSSATWQMLKDAESDPECRDYYGEAARNRIVEQAYQNLKIMNCGYTNDIFDKMKEDETQRIFIELLEQMESKPALKKERYPVVLVCVLGGALVLLLLFFLYFIRNLKETRQSSFQNQEEVTSEEGLIENGEREVEDVVRELEGISRKFNSRKSVVVSMGLSGDMTIDGEETDIMIQMGISSITDPQVIHRTVNAGIVTGGDVWTQNMEIYEEGYDVRYRSGNENNWMASEDGTGINGTGAAVFREISGRFTEFRIAEFTGIGESSCYILEGAVNGQTVAAFIPEVTEILFEEAELSSKKALPQQNVMEERSVECVIIVNAETLLPESAVFDLTEIMQEQSVSQGNDVRKYTMEISYLDYDSLDMITVPSDNHSGASGILYNSEGEESGEY